MTNDTPSEVVKIGGDALFPITVTAGDSKVVLYANGNLVGDPEKLKEGLAALQMKDNGIGAVVLWLLLREMTATPENWHSPEDDAWPEDA